MYRYRPQCQTSELMKRLASASDVSSFSVFS
jgi:hypothetical protein